MRFPKEITCMFYPLCFTAWPRSTIFLHAVKHKGFTTCKWLFENRETCRICILFQKMKYTSFRAETKLLFKILKHKNISTHGWDIVHWSLSLKKLLLKSLSGKVVISYRILNLFSSCLELEYSTWSKLSSEPIKA